MENGEAKRIPGPSYAKNELNIYAIITARGGSKRLPGKNLRLLAGKPLLAYSIEAARACPLVSRCFVSTEDREIMEVSRKWGAEVIRRPEELAKDGALSKDVVRHALEDLAARGLLPHYFVLLQPTSPLRTAEHLQLCIAQFLTSGAKSAVSVTKAEHHPFKMFGLDEDGFLIKTVPNGEMELPAQSLPAFYRTNGAIYLAASKNFLEHDTFYLDPILPFFMSPEESVDIDTWLDFEIAALLLTKKQKGRE